MLSVILVNALALFLYGFPELRREAGSFLIAVDYACLVFFVVEAILKIRTFGFKAYWQSGWNKLDFIIVVISLPLFLDLFIKAHPLQDLTFVLLLRLGRLLRFARLMRFVPDATMIWGGVLRALRASLAVILVLFVLNVILAMGANFLFGSEKALEPYFGDPLISFYSLFKVFTIEGWHEIPDEMAKSGVSTIWIFVLRSYFMVAVLVGGLLGMSLANAVFVDQMVADNTDHLEEMVRDLQSELRAFRSEMQALHQQLAEANGGGKENSPGEL